MTLSVSELLETSALTISGPQAAKSLQVYSVTGTEALSELFEYQIEVVSEIEEIDLKALLGETITLQLPIEGRPTRYFNGIVVAAARLGSRGRFASFKLTLAPHLWLLTRTRDCRIFQDSTVPEVVTKIFRSYGLTYREQLFFKQYRKWDYLTQYHESDYAFVRRILAHEGIYFYFGHREDGHDVVLADSEAAHEALPGFEIVPLVRPLEKGEVPDYLSSWTARHGIQPDGITLGDYEFRLRGRATLLRSSQSVAAPKRAASDQDANRAFIHYSYPGHSTLAENDAEANASQCLEEGERLARVRLDEQRWRHEVFAGEGTARGLATGHLFGILNAHPGQQFLITSTTTSLRNSLFETGADAAGERCKITLQAIDSKTPYRPQRQTKPTMPGPQTARVVGPEGHEIWTDKFGRVRIQLHWDREGEYDESSACWVRVAQPWAGNRWGAIFNPRIGNEVVVDFLDGDPDRPLITGSVYNADNMPPYSLPTNQTQGGVKTRSSKGGNPDNFNELRFEDKKGEEQVYVQAEKDLDVLVKNDEAREIGHDRNKVVGNDETTRVDRNRTETVGGDETITITGSRAEEVGKDETIRIVGSRSETVSGDEDLSIRGGRSEAVGKDETVTIDGHRSVKVNRDESLAVGGSRMWAVEKDENGAVQGERIVSVGKGDSLRVGGAWVIDAGDHVIIKSGAASLTLKANGDIVLKGKNLFLDGGGKINVKASGELAMTGANIKEN
jgi:type VI secretion system secreted protein VgrG